MRVRLVRGSIVALLTLGLAGIHPLTTFAATTVNDCPTTESALSKDISTAGNGGTVTFTCAGDTTIPFTSAITIGQSVTLDASSASGTVTFDGGGKTSFFVVNSNGNSEASLSLIRLTLQHGNSTGYGGAISNNGTVTITNSTLSGNSAPNGLGGAIYNSGTLTITSSTLSGNTGVVGGAIRNGGTLTITDSAFFGNSADGLGGAISNSGPLTITTSTLSGNSVPNGFGGAIYSFGPVNASPVKVTITTSTLSGNSARLGGAIMTQSGTMTITTSTFSGNSAAVSGGAIAAQNDTMTIDTSTLSGNSAQFGGAIFNTGTLTLGGSIVANSTSGGDCTGISITDTGYNLSDDSSCGLSTAKHDLLNTNPQLGPLQNNGGPTPTMALAPTSPAIDQIPTGTASLCPGSGIDQRGEPRPDAGESLCDIGAYEFQETTTTVTSSQNPSFSGQPVTFTATVSSSSATGTIQFSIDGKPVGSPVTLVGGKASSPAITTLAPGTHTVTAMYSGDTIYQGSTGSLKQTVQPSVLRGALATSIHPTESQPFSGPVATFTDTNTYISASQLTAIIHWGDGSSSPGTVSGSNGSFTVSGSHTYADEGSFPVSVTLQETTPGHASGTARGTVTVAEGDVLTPITSTLPAATASRSYALAATFIDTNTSASPADFHATISWGDGTTSTGTVSGSTGHLIVSGQHTYSLTGSYPVTVTLADDAPGTARATATASLRVTAPASSPHAVVTTLGSTPCTSILSDVSILPGGSATGRVVIQDERPGGIPCDPTRPGVLNFRSVSIDALVCTSATTASVYGQVQQGGAAGAVTSFRADVVMTNPTARINGSVSVQTSSGYSSAVTPATVHISGC